MYERLSLSLRYNSYIFYLSGGSWRSGRSDWRRNHSTCRVNNGRGQCTSARSQRTIGQGRLQKPGFNLIFVPEVHSHLNLDSLLSFHITCQVARVKPNVPKEKGRNPWRPFKNTRSSRYGATLSFYSHHHVSNTNLLESRQDGHGNQQYDEHGGQ